MESIVMNFYRFSDLQTKGIVNNRTTLQRWQKSLDFPKPVRLGPNTAVFEAQAVDDWCKRRQAAGAVA
jgi:predicted DNA-binding transcriptional regulator AlpA